jgi:hypothetical protein
MRKACLVAALAACVGACATAPQITDRSDFLKEATRTYQGESAERVIRAAQRVLDQSDPKYFEFRNTLNGFSGLRHYYVYAVLASASGSDRWDFTAEREPTGAIKAGVTVTDVGAAQNGYNRTAYDSAMTSVPLYRLFWSRVDYVLGRSEDWQTCDDAEVQFHDTKISPLVRAGRPLRPDKPRKGRRAAGTLGAAAKAAGRWRACSDSEARETEAGLVGRYAVPLSARASSSSPT